MSSLADRLRGIVRPARPHWSAGLNGDGRGAGPVPRIVARGRSQMDAAPRFSAANGTSAGGIVPRRRSQLRARLSPRLDRPSPIACRRTTAGPRLSAARRDVLWRDSRSLPRSRDHRPRRRRRHATRSSSAAAGSIAARFHVRQFFLSDFAAERALLEAVGDLAG